MPSESMVTTQSDRANDRVGNY